MIEDEQYEIIRCIHRSEGTRVYQVRHTGLDTIRIMKQIDKDKGSSNRVSYEARLLCGLRHPGIPILYDYREDEDSVCLIEEYIRGVSLAEHLVSKRALNMNDAIRYIVEIGDILEYLHTRRPYPILYRDLKPEHIILREDHPVLIDYDVALLSGAAGEIRIAGTPGHSAPEQFEGSKLDESCDLYALGMVAKELIKATGEKTGRKAARLIHDATSANPADRPQSLQKWCDELKKTGADGEEGCLCKRISVMGTDNGVGTTHIAISLCVVLNHMGCRAVYIDKSQSNATQYILRNRPEYFGRDGFIYHGDFAGIANCGPAIVERELPDGIHIVDCGTDQTKAEDADIILYVCSSRAWRRVEPRVETAGQNCCYSIINPPDIAAGIRLARELGKRTYAFPMDKDPFSVTRGKLRLFEDILSREGIRFRGRKVKI